MATPSVPAREVVSSSVSGTSGTSNPQRKILEDLQFKKQMFLKQGVSQALTPASSTHQSTVRPRPASVLAFSRPTVGWQSGTDGHLAGTGNTQRSTLLAATSHSFGSFIAQDSSFGNSILPVLPRLDAAPSLKPLQAHLEDVRGFEDPKISLEQYVTPAHIAAHLLHAAHMNFGDIADKAVADLGCGCGVLAIGAAMLGAAAVTGYDIDEDALAVCRDNLEELELTDSVELVRSDVKELLVEDCRWKESFDTVILNPPFGTKNNQGADLQFLQAASALSREAVYSLHKTSTRKHLLRKAAALGLTGEVLAELRYDLPKTYDFHKKSSVDVHVDFIRFVKKAS